MGFFSSDFNPKFQNTLFLENLLVATADHSAKGIICLFIYSNKTVWNIFTIIKLFEI